MPAEKNTGNAYELQSALNEIEALSQKLNKSDKEIEQLEARIRNFEALAKVSQNKSDMILRDKLLHWKGVNYDLYDREGNWIPPMYLKGEQRNKDGSISPISGVLKVFIPPTTKGGKGYHVDLVFIDGRCVTNDRQAAMAAFNLGIGISVMHVQKDFEPIDEEYNSEEAEEIFEEDTVIA